MMAQVMDVIVGLMLVIGAFFALQAYLHARWRVWCFSC